MTDARWIEVEDDIAAACLHLGNAARLYDEGGLEAPELSGYRARMALLHAVQSGHTSLEAALKRILEILGEEPPAGDLSHSQLVRRVSREIATEGHVRPAILPESIAIDVDETRRFRHRATHDYDNFEPGLAATSIEAARRLAVSLKPCIDTFRVTIDPADRAVPPSP